MANTAPENNGIKPLSKGQEIKVRSLFASSWSAYRPVFFPLWGSTLLTLLPIVLLAATLPGIIDSRPPLAVIIGAGMLFLLLAANIVFIALPTFLLAEHQQQTETDGLFKRAAQKLPAHFKPLFLTSFAFAVLLASSAYLGALFLILPGMVIPVVLGSYWAVVFPVLLLETPGNMAAFSRSSQLTAGRRWLIVKLLAVLIALFLVLAFLAFLLINASQVSGKEVELLVMSIATVAAISAVIPFFHLVPASLYYRLIAE